MVNSEKNRVLSVSIAILQGQYINQYHYIMAASVMATLPMIIIFLLGQKNLVSGIVITGIKG